MDFKFVLSRPSAEPGSSVPVAVFDDLKDAFLFARKVLGMSDDDSFDNYVDGVLYFADDNEPFYSEPDDYDETITLRHA